MTKNERLNRVENQVSELTANVNGLVRELKDFKDEMRDRDNQRAEDIREIRASLQSMQASNRSLNIVTILGIAALVIAVLLK